MIEYTSGDILKADVEALVNPVNCVGVMGAGLALQFKKAFPENFRIYKKACQQGRIEIGSILVTALIGVPTRYIVNFPTKYHWRDSSQVLYIQLGLDALCAKIDRMSIKSIAIPALGCGLGKLQWGDVKPLIEKYMNIDGVRVVVYEPMIQEKHNV